MTITKIEELIGDKEILHTLLEGFLSGWNGTFDVRPADIPDPKEYLFNSGNLSDFCKKVKNDPIGEVLCKECDKEHALLAYEQGKSIHYLCHAGLIDIAVPIIIDGELIATIFCGQSRSWDKGIESEGCRRTSEVAQKLGFNARELLRLRKFTQEVTEEKIEAAKQGLWKVSTYMAARGLEKAKLLKEKSAFEQIRKEMRRESEQIQNILNTLSTIVEVDKFWLKLDETLMRICETIGADHAAIFVLEDDVFLLKSVANLHREDFLESYPGDAVIFREAINKKVPQITKFITSIPNTFNSALASVIQSRPDKSALIPFELSEENQALMFFLLSDTEDKKSGLPIEKEAEILSQITPQIATAYHNCGLYQERQNEFVLRRKWFRRVTHQFLSPLHGLQGYADDAWMRLWRWRKIASQDITSLTSQQACIWREELERWESSFESIRWTSHYAARLAQNMAWLVYSEDPNENEKPDLTLVDDICGLLIKCARDFQGIARERGLRRVEVNTQSIACLSKRICINDDLFRQAVGNLIDNAVKYSNKGTDVLIEGGIIEKRAEIQVINYGICLYPEEIEKVFEEGYRGKEAYFRYQTGTGIGLKVARQIIALHDGKLIALPSEVSNLGWKTRFTISLPIKSDENS